MIFKFPFLIKGNPFDVPLGMQIFDAPLVENCEKHKFFAMFRKIGRVQLCGEREKETRVKIYLRTNVTRASAQTQTWNEGSDLVKKQKKNIHFFWFAFLGRESFSLQNKVVFGWFLLWLFPFWLCNFPQSISTTKRGDRKLEIRLLNIFGSLTGTRSIYRSLM